MFASVGQFDDDAETRRRRNTAVALNSTSERSSPRWKTAGLFPFTAGAAFPAGGDAPSSRVGNNKDVASVVGS